MVEGGVTQKGSGGSHSAHFCKAVDTREVRHKVVQHEFSSMEEGLLGSTRLSYDSFGTCMAIFACGCSVDTKM